MQDNHNSPRIPENNDFTSPQENTSNAPTPEYQKPPAESTDWTSPAPSGAASTPPLYDAPKPSAPPSGPYGAASSGYDNPSAPYGHAQPTGNYGQPPQPPQYSPYGQAPPNAGQRPYHGQNQYPGAGGMFAGLSSSDPAVKDEEISKWVGIAGVVSWWLGWFTGGFTFLLTIAAGIVGLVYAFRARGAGRKATAGLVLGWLNSLGTVVSVILALILLAFVFAAVGSGFSY